MWQHVFIMKDYHMYGWRIFMLFYVCAWKTHHLSPKQKESFYTLTMVGLGAFTFSHRELSCSSLFPFSISSLPFVLKLMLSWLVWKMWSRYKELDKEPPHSWNCLPVGEHNALSRFLRVTQSWLISAIRPRRVFGSSLFPGFRAVPLFRVLSLCFVKSGSLKGLVGWLP